MYDLSVTERGLFFMLGDVAGKENVLVRVHSECLTGDVFHSLRCDCGAQLEEAMRRVQEEGEGVVLYIVGHEGRGIGLANKLRAYELQEQGADTVEANAALGFAPDLRDYGIGAQILCDLGLHSIRLMTNNPRKIEQLQALGIKVSGRIPHVIPATEFNRFYLETKAARSGHLIEFEGKLKTSIEQSGQTQQELDFGSWQATVSYGYPQYDGRRPPGTSDAHGVALVAQLGPDEFLVTAVDAAVSFHLPARLPGMRMQILSAEEGSYKDGAWKAVRLWNGDETDRGLQFRADDPAIVRIRLGKF